MEITNPPGDVPNKGQGEWKYVSDGELVNKSNSAIFNTLQYDKWWCQTPSWGPCLFCSYFGQNNDYEHGLLPHVIWHNTDYTLTCEKTGLFLQFFLLMISHQACPLG